MVNKKYQVVELVVESESKSGTYYKAKQWSDGNRTCALKSNGFPCKDHYWRKRDCKHIKKLLAKLDDEGITYVQ
jgi:hypothetical protein